MRRAAWPLLALLGGCMGESPQSWLRPAGPVAEMQLDLFMFVVWISAAIFLVVGGLLVASLVRFRARPGDRGLPEQSHGDMRLEIGLIAASLVILAIITVPNVKMLFTLAAVPEGETIEVRVVAKQWWWAFEYPEFTYTDEMGLERVLATANELVVPVGSSVLFQITSDDVIHSFWVPRLGGKVDAIPGKDNFLWLRADVAGTFYGQCAELCGASHALMRFRVHALEPDEFQAWVDSQKMPASPPEAMSVAAEGAGLFLSKGCAVCHTVRGLPGALGTIGPELTHFASRSTMAAGIMDNTHENLVRWLKNPEAVKAGNRMAGEAPVYTDPDLALTGTELEALVAYLRGLK